MRPEPSKERSAASVYRQRSPEVEAIQFLGTGESCSAVTDFLGGGYATNHRWNKTTTTGGRIKAIPSDGFFHEFAPGDWIVRHSDGKLQVLADEDFGRLYEEAS